MLCEFYSWTIDYTMGLTMRQYNKAFEEMGTIQKIKAGIKVEEPMGGNLGAAAARKILPSKGSVYGKTR